MRGNNNGTGRGSGEGRRIGAGPKGNCQCPNCGYSAPHQPGQPCSSVKCPKCGTPLIRQ